MTTPLIVTAAIIRDDKRILITRRPEGKRYAGKWEFPGGKLDLNETPQDCLKRELKEELDINVEVGDIFEVIHFNYPWGPILLLFYNCTKGSVKINNIQVAEHRFVEISELDDFDFLPADKPIIEKLQKN